MSEGYLTLVSQAGPCGPAVPCRYRMLRMFGKPMLDVAVPPEHGPSTRLQVKRRHRRNAAQRHCLALYSPGGRLITVIDRRYSVSGADAYYVVAWRHRDEDGWYCTAAWPTVIEELR